MIRMATCFDPVGSSSGFHYEPDNYKAAYILEIPNNVQLNINLLTFLGS